jgi:hypothetical protein
LAAAPRPAVVEAPPFCADSFSAVAGFPDAFMLAVDTCGAVRRGADGWPEMTCTVRDIIDTGGSVVAAAEAYSLTWPQFSHRPEGSYRSFRDPIPGCIFEVRLADDAADLRVRAAEQRGDATCSAF